VPQNIDSHYCKDFDFALNDILAFRNANYDANLNYVIHDIAKALL